MVSIGIIVGSLRQGSYSRSVAECLAQALEERASVSFIDISDVQLFNQDLEEEGREPASWQRLRQAVATSDGVLFVTPEYNRSVPAAMKNVLDVASRPAGKSVWAGKAGAVVSVSPSRMGAFGAYHHLRQSLDFLDVRVMNQPETYVADITLALDDDGTVADEQVKARLGKYADAIVSWIEANTATKTKAKK
jgi:chromate reductase